VALNEKYLYDKGYYSDGSTCPGDAVPELSFDPVIGSLGQSESPKIEVKVNL